MAEKTWGGEPFWGLGYDWDPDWLLTERQKELRAKLIERQEEEREAEMARLRGEHVEAGWGNQIRSYVLQPYTMVKDLRTGVETANPNSVLDGELDAFIEGYLRWRVGDGRGPEEPAA